MYIEVFFVSNVQEGNMYINYCIIWCLFFYNRCAEGYVGDPSRPGDACRRREVERRPNVIVSPTRVEESVASTVVLQVCSADLNVDVL